MGKSLCVASPCTSCFSWPKNAQDVLPCAGGIGIETARALHDTGADVFITTRDRGKGQAALDSILTSSTGNGKLELLILELDSLASVRAAVKDFLLRSKILNVLINNAGQSGCIEPALPCRRIAATLNDMCSSKTKSMPY